MGNIAIKVKGVYKNFRLPHEKHTTVKSLFTNLLKRRSVSQKQIETQHALRDISFEVKEGEFFGIVGRNGSGKSTLLKILAGIYQPNKGLVTINGRLVPFIELGVGFNGELTGRENVYLNGAMLGFTVSEIDEIYNDIVKFAELEKFMDQKLKNYSSGMQVRLAFSMAIRAQADILLVDEVLAVGDADFQRKCYQYFKELKHRKKTVVFVSHDMSAVREYCDRAVLIEDSKIVAMGAANQIATEYIKMFNSQPRQEKDKQKSSDNKYRWGDKGLEIESVSTLINKDYLNIVLRVKANKNAEDPVFGYLIKDSAGNELFGSNTKIKNVKIGKIKRGDAYELDWRVPNIFNDGIFSVTVAISHNDGISQHDWWENADAFTIFREDKTPYALNPNSEVKFTKK
jgi:ABC-2 type transport system ATP-binding protein